MNLIDQSSLLGTIFHATTFGYFKGTKVAVITCEGNVHRGKTPPSWNDQSIGGDSTVKAIESAIKDNVKAIIIRVDSGGGSYVASDHIANTILRAKAKGIKIIVSMGNIAASGGYYISQNADKIVASPGTITGSIGVVLGKFNIRNLFQEHLGITFDSIRQSESSALYSTITGYSEENQNKMEETIDYIYNDFKQKVSAGRNISVDDLEELAQGKIWMGKQALENNLIDVLGGYRTAISEAKKSLDIPETGKVNLIQYPKKSIFDIFKNGRKSSRDDEDYINNTVSGIIDQKILFSPVKSLLNSVGLSGNMLLPQNGRGIQMSIQQSVPYRS